MELRDRPLFEAQESLRIIADRINIGLFKTNASGQIDFVNNAACTLLGFIVKDQTRLKLPESGSIIFGTQWDKVVKDHWALAQRGRTGDFQIDHDRGRILHINYYPIKNGEYLGTVGIIRDVTAERTVLQDLYRLKEEFRNDFRRVG